MKETNDICCHHCFAIKMSVLFFISINLKNQNKKHEIETKNQSSFLAERLSYLVAVIVIVVFVIVGSQPQRTHVHTVESRGLDTDWPYIGPSLDKESAESRTRQNVRSQC